MRVLLELWSEPAPTRARGIVDTSGLIATYGYPLVVVGAVLEGETVVIAAGYMAHRHHLSFPVVVACAAIGGSVGDLGFFLIGRRFGERAVAHLPSSVRKSVARARDAVRDNPKRVLLTMRFLYGMRMALPILCGASPMPLRRFGWYDVATAIVWSLLFSGIGYAFGAAATVAIHEIERYEWVVLLGAISLGLIVHQVSRRLRPWVGSKSNADAR